MNIKNYLKENKKNIYNNLFLILFTIMILVLNSKNVSASTTQESFKESFNNLSSVIRSIALFISGLSVISAIGAMIYHLIRLGASGSNPQARAKIIQDMLTTGVCLGLLGSIGFVISFVTTWLFN